MPNLTFDHVLERARTDERVTGLFLGGSRGKGANVRPDSDYDVRVVGDAEDLGTERGGHVEVAVMSLERFRDYPEWDRYTLTHVEALIDRTGEIQRVIDEKGRLSEAEARELAPAALDGYMNSLYRSLKRPGLGGRLHAAEANASLMTCLFALEGRVRPFHDYLEWELETYPLDGWADLPNLLEGDPHELFRRVETHVRARGLGEVVDAWEPDVPFMRHKPWRRYYDAAKDEPRDTLVLALDRFEQPGLAVDLGCGTGRDTAELLRRGWSVVAVDGQEEAIERLRARLGEPAGLETQVARFEDFRFPHAQLVNSSYALPFCPPDAFPAVWGRLVEALVSGARFSGHLFGDRDDWAKTGGSPQKGEITFHTRPEIERLIAPFDVELFDEVEDDHQTASGEDKHWHLYNLVLRKP